MATIFEIPINETGPSFKIRTVLDDRTLVLRFDWNVRIETWVLQISDGDELPVLMGIPLRINCELLGRFEIDALPPGSLMLFDTTGKNAEAGRDDLGKRAKLLYESAS